ASSLCCARPPRPPLFPYTTLFRSLANVPRGLGGPSRQGSYFISDYRKPTPMLSCPGGFDSGIQREQIGLLGDIRNHTGDLLDFRSEEHTSELQSRENLVCRLLLEK